MTEPEITVKKMTAYLPISTELAMDCGLIPDTRPPSPPAEPTDPTPLVDLSPAGTRRGVALPHHRRVHDGPPR